MQLLPNEERLVFSNQDQIVLTNQRIRLTNKEWGRSYQITIFLENISSIESLYKSNPLFAVLAGVGFLFGVMQLGQGQNDNGTLIFASFAAAVIFLILWLNSQRQVVIISSDGGSKLNFRTAGMAATQVQDFIDKVQAAQAKRIAELHKL